MLINYSQRSFELLYRPFSNSERAELYSAFRRLGEMMDVAELPKDYTAWQTDRRLHLERDLEYTHYSHSLFDQYRKHLGEWRHRLLLDVQALIVPHRVRRLLSLTANNPLSYLIWSHGIVDVLQLQTLVKRALLPPEHREAIKRLNRSEII